MRGKFEKLKSDQDGIERINSYNVLVFLLNLLKSDQDGIESPAEVADELLKQELKSDQDGIESYFFRNFAYYFNYVEIRPRWD